MKKGDWVRSFHFIVSKFCLEELSLPVSVQSVCCRTLVLDVHRAWYCLPQHWKPHCDDGSLNTTCDISLEIPHSRHVLLYALSDTSHDKSVETSFSECASVDTVNDTPLEKSADLFLST